MNNLRRKETESDTDYKFRICRDREILGLNTWNEVAKFLNSVFDADWGESKYRKWFSSFNEGFNYAMDSDSYMKELELQRIELEKEKVRMRDQRREYNALIRQQARYENLCDMVKLTAEDVERIKPLNVAKKSHTKSGVKGIALWGDFHVGYEIDNQFNKYNREVFEERFSELLARTIHYGERNNVSELTVANLGDAINGIIHVTTRIQNGEDVIQQLKYVAERIAEGLSILANHFDKINYINIIGNHSRITANKNDSIYKENLEYIIPWYLEARLKDFKNISLSNDEDGIFVQEVEGEKFVYVHGDCDHVASVAKSLPQLLGFVPKYIFGAHIHHKTLKEYGRTTVITNGSLCGIDSYALSKRLYSSPSQKLLILDGADIEVDYTINLK